WRTNQLPIFTGYPFVYPFIADALTGITSKITGVSLFVAHQSWGFILTSILLITLFGFYKSFTKSFVVALLGVSIFLLSGGLGFVDLIANSIDTGVRDTWINLSPPYTDMPDKGVVWINP